jgi:hypothetical protein
MQLREKQRMAPCLTPLAQLRFTVHVVSRHKVAACANE